MLYCYQNELFLKIFKVKIWFQNRRSKFKKQIKSMNTTGGSEQRSPNIHRQSDMGQSGNSENFLDIARFQNGIMGPASDWLSHIACFLEGRGRH